MIESTLGDLRTVRIVILLVSTAAAGLGLWKRSQDLDDLVFVQEQVKRAASTVAPRPSAAMQKRLQRDHRNALLTISEKERELRELGPVAGRGTPLRDAIEREVQQMRVSASSTFSNEDTAWFHFEDDRVHEVHTALAIDLLLLWIAPIGLVCGAVMWLMELRRSFHNREKV